MSWAPTTTAGRALAALALAGGLFAVFFLVGRAIGSDGGGETATPEPAPTAGTEPREPVKLALAPPAPNLILPKPPRRDRQAANSADSTSAEAPLEEQIPAVAETPATPEAVVAPPTAAPEPDPEPAPEPDPGPDPAPEPEPEPTEPPVSFDDSG